MPALSLPPVSDWRYRVETTAVNGACWLASGWNGVFTSRRHQDIIQVSKEMGN